ncbi:MAG: bacillithiol biosynthesis deacetylase BshB1 [Bryobacterales bacterium]|nr:bacillithiol biosynthesis deacetylase BshB1 [Bryobacteraceae bacterium]MDW8130073.1 bacillithiol biosynthesis deacetylase BshB1 [Bryobacterales bacterium]
MAEERVALEILAIAAHPDDVEQTCGGTLIRMAGLGYRTGVLDLTAGEMGTRGDPAIRLREAAEAGRLLGLAWRGNLHLPDGRLENTFEVRLKVAAEIRRLRPRVVILPYWQARHPDHVRACEIGYEACFLAGLRKIETGDPPFRPRNVLYSSLYASVAPTFVVDISEQFDRRMEALLAYRSQYGRREEASELFPDPEEIRERLAGIARYYGNLIGVRYGEPFVTRETLRVDDIVALGSPSF